MENNTFSVSRINLFDQCPLRWKLHYIDRIPESPTPELQIGNAMHTAIEIFCKQCVNGHKRKSIEDIVAEATSTVHNGDILKEINEMMKDFVLTHEFNGRKITGIEQEFTKDVGGYKFKGILDLVEINGDDTAIITDWKTGRRIYSRTEAHNSLQASAYALLLHKEYPKLKTFVCRFDFVKHGQVIETKRRLSDIQLTEKYLNRKMDTISEAVKKEDFPPKPSHFCEFCSYAANHCPIEVDTSTPEQLAARVLVLESILKDNRTRLKALVEKHEAVSINNEVFDFYPSETENYPVTEFMNVLNKHKIDSSKFLKVNTKNFKYLNPEILGELLPLAETVVSTRFGHKQKKEGE